MRNHVKCVNYGAWNPFNKFLYSSCSLPGIKLGNWAQRKASLGVFFLTVNLKRFLFVIGCFFPRTFICFFFLFCHMFSPRVYIWCGQLMILWFRLIHPNKTQCAGQPLYLLLYASDFSSGKFHSTIFIFKWIKCS